MLMITMKIISKTTTVVWCGVVWCDSDRCDVASDVRMKKKTK
jgi:hypothetical protein